MIASIRIPMIVLGGSVCTAAPSRAQQPQQQQQSGAHAADIARIRELATTRRQSFTGGLYTDSAIFWSGAYARPEIGFKDTVTAEALPGTRLGERRDVQAHVTIRRIEVAQAGDMAYEFSDYTLSAVMTNDNQTRTVAGSLLRVWKKINADWKVVAGFMRPYGGVIAQ
jgi:hypothetical protein